jgi:hypothetical protein
MGRQHSKDGRFDWTESICETQREPQNFRIKCQCSALAVDMVTITDTAVIGSFMNIKQS